MTLAQNLFKGKQLLVERPPDMTYNEYRQLLAVQNRTIKKLFRHKPSRNIAKLMPLTLHYNLHL